MVDNGSLFPVLAVYCQMWELLPVMEVLSNTLLCLKINMTMNIINSPVALIEAIEYARNKHGPECWWRGHADTKWFLQPRIIRENRLEVEQEIIQRFAQKASFLDQNSPNLNEPYLWKFFAQHHGLPTRLLDWSMSALVAAWFACSPVKQKEHDGCIWMLDPWKFNELTTGDKTVFSYINSIPESIKPIFDSPIKSENKTQSAAIISKYGAPRMMAQHAAFTVHASIEPLEIENLDNCCLEKFEIPAEVKGELLAILGDMGIKLSILFPTLDKLAQEIDQSLLKPA